VVWCEPKPKKVRVNEEGRPPSDSGEWAGAAEQAELLQMDWPGRPTATQPMRWPSSLAQARSRSALAALCGRASRACWWVRCTLATSCSTRMARSRLPVWLEAGVKARRAGRNVQRDAREGRVNRLKEKEGMGWGVACATTRISISRWNVHVDKKFGPARSSPDPRPLDSSGWTPS